MSQLDHMLGAPANDAPLTDPFAAARAKHPDARLVLVLDRRPGSVEWHMLVVPPSSAWHALLPEQQICQIRPKGALEEDITAEQLRELLAVHSTIHAGAEAPDTRRS